MYLVSNLIISRVFCINKIGVGGKKVEKGKFYLEKIYINFFV